MFQNPAKKNNSIDDVEAFLKKNSKKRIKAVVESVIDGSTIKLMLLPEGYMITLYLSGIKVIKLKLCSMINNYYLLFKILRYVEVEFVQN